MGLSPEEQNPLTFILEAGKVKQKQKDGERQEAGEKERECVERMYLDGYPVLDEETNLLIHGLHLLLQGLVLTHQLGQLPARPAIRLPNFRKEFKIQKQRNQ